MKQLTTIQKVKSTLDTWSLKNKNVFVRIDGDVPLKKGTILDDSRLMDCLPTLHFLKAAGAHVIVATHIGRPTDHEPELSTKQLVHWFQKQGFSVTFANDLLDAKRKIKSFKTDILMLENLRFNKEEQHPNPEYAQGLACLGDYYVNEAFGTSHRDDCSLTLVPELFDAGHRSVGFKCADEINTLNYFFHHPKRPYSAILGGGKVADKLPLIEALLERADHILLCPALVFTFMKAQGKNVGSSLVADKVLDHAQRILTIPSARTKLVFPLDYQVAHNTIDGSLSIIDAHAFTDDLIGIAIGPKTIQLYSEYITEAHTVFFNGPMGFIEKKDTIQATCVLLTALAQSKAHTIIGGGDSAQFANSCSVTDKITFISSGGGAALAYISGTELPGLRFFV